MLVRSGKAYILVLLVALLALGGCSDDEKETSSNSIQEVSPAALEQQEPKIQATFGYGPAEFVKRYNASGRKIKSGFKAKDMKKTFGEVNNTFTVVVNKNIAIMGTLEKSNNRITDVTMIGTGDGTQESGANIFLGMAQLMAAVAPELDKADRGEVLREMGLLGSDEGIQDGDKGNCVRGKKKFFYLYGEATGLWFGIEALP